MDFNEKAAARSKYRSTQHLKRVHGGRGRGRGQHAPSEAREPELESNYDRYSISDEEEAAEGEVARQSEGADLEQLLAESEQFHAQAHFRYRSFIETVDLEPPPVDVSVIEQELAIEPELLVQALARLPLSEFLGLEPHLLVGLEDQILDSSGLPVSDPQGTTYPQQQQQQVERTQQQGVPHQQQQQPQQPFQQSQQQQQQQQPPGTKQQQQQQLAAQPPLEQLPFSCSTSTGSKPVGTEDPPPPIATAPAAHGDDVLEHLLKQTSSSSSSTAGNRQQHTATSASSTGAPAGSTVASAGQQQGASSSFSSNAAGSIPVTGSQQHVQPAAVVGRLPGPGVMTAKASAPAVHKAVGAGVDGKTDHEMIEARGTSEMSSGKGAQPTAVNNGTVAARRSNKKQSLEDWLDGL